MRTKLFFNSTQNQRYFNVELYRWIKFDKSTLNQRVYHVDRRRDVISTYINVESTLFPGLGNFKKNSRMRGVPSCLHKLNIFDNNSSKLKSVVRKLQDSMFLS